MADAALSFPRFRSRLPWWGRDLQTLRNYIVSIESSLAPFPAERVEFPTTDLAPGEYRLRARVEAGGKTAGSAIATIR